MSSTGGIMIVSHSSARGTVRIGVLGCGYWGSKHARVLAGAHGVAELSLIDSDGDAACRLGRTYSTAQVSPNLQSALPCVDAVVIATPPRTHAELAMLAMRAGKHVLIEKPLATSVREARALLAQADRSRVTLMVGHTFLYNPALHELRRRVRV